MERIKTLLADAQAAFGRMTQRERRLVLLCGGAVLAFVLFFTFFSFAETARVTRRRTEDKLHKLAEVQELAATFRDAEQARQNVERQLAASNVKLISYLEEKGGGVGLDDFRMDPKTDVSVGEDGRIIESAVELTLTDIKLGQLVTFLQQVEAGPGVVKVKYLRVEPRTSNDTLTAWATIATYHMKQ